MNKHLAKVDGIPVFNALWTCMDSRYICAQALTLTKAHDKCYGPLNGVARSIKHFGHSMPQITFSDDPVKVDPVYCMFKIGFTCYQDARMLTTAFSSLKEGLTPMAAAYGLAAVRATAERLSRDLAGDPKHIYKHKYNRKVHLAGDPKRKG